MKRSTLDTATALCYWCHGKADESPYRSPIEGIPGGRFVVCSPQCPERPEGVRVVTAALR